MLDHHLIVLLATGERGEVGLWRRLEAGGSEAGERSTLRVDRTHRRADCGGRAGNAAAGIAVGGWAGVGRQGQSTLIS